jgi:hypothetical protein
MGMLERTLTKYLKEIERKSMNKTFEEIVNMPDLDDGVTVSARIGESTFDGKIVGKSSSGLIPCYIVECLDGTLPNKTYKYKFVSLPLSEILIK